MGRYCLPRKALSPACRQAGPLLPAGLSRRSLCPRNSPGTPRPGRHWPSVPNVSHQTRFPNATQAIWLVLHPNVSRTSVRRNARQGRWRTTLPCHDAAAHPASRRSPVIPFNSRNACQAHWTNTPAGKPNILQSLESAGLPIGQRPSFFSFSCSNCCFVASDSISSIPGQYSFAMSKTVCLRLFLTPRSAWRETRSLINSPSPLRTASKSGVSLYPFFWSMMPK